MAIGNPILGGGVGPSYTNDTAGSDFFTSSALKTNTGLSVTVPKTGYYMVYVKAEVTNGVPILRNQTDATEIAISGEDYLRLGTWILNRPYLLTEGHVLEIQVWKNGGFGNVTLYGGSSLEIVSVNKIY